MTLIRNEDFTRDELTRIDPDAVDADQLADVWNALNPERPITAAATSAGRLPSRDARGALERLLLWRDASREAGDFALGVPPGFAADVVALLSTVEQMREALKPFSVGGPAELLAAEDYSVMRERIVDWFGPSDFKAAREAYGATPTEDSHDR